MFYHAQKDILGILNAQKAKTYREIIDELKRVGQHHWGIFAYINSFERRGLIKRGVRKRIKKGEFISPGYYAEDDAVYYEFSLTKEGEQKQLEYLEQDVNSIVQKK